MMICILSENGHGNDSIKYTKNEFSAAFKKMFNVELDYSSWYIQQELNKLINKQIFINQKMFCWDKAEESKSVNYPLFLKSDTI